MTSSAAEGSLGAWLRRLPTYLYLVDLLPGRRVLEVGCGLGYGAQFLADHGAGQVVGVDRSEASIADARARHRQINLEFRCEEFGSIELDDGSFDCVFVPDGIDVLRRSSVLGELRRLLTPGGYLVLCGQSADRRGSPGGASFYEFRERLERFFPPVRMVAQAPFVGFSLVEFAGSFAGRDEPLLETHLDTSLMELAGGEPEAIDYVAVCGGPGGRTRGYAVVQVPERDGIDALSLAIGMRAGAPTAEGRDDLAPALAPPIAPAAIAPGPARPDTSPDQGGDPVLVHELRLRLETAIADRARAQAQLDELTAQVQAGRGQADELRAENGELRQSLAEAAELAESRPAAAAGPSPSEQIAEALAAHRDAVRSLEIAVEEGEAYAEELRSELEQAAAQVQIEASGRLRGETRAERLDAELREWRTRGSTAEGKLLRLAREAGEAAPARVERPAPRADLGAVASDGADRARVVALEAELARAQRGWQEAEAQLQAVRAERAQERERHEGNGDGSQNAAAAGAESIGREVARRLAHVELEIETGRSLIQQVEGGLADLERQAARDAAERAPSAWAAHRDQQLRELSAELGIKDAEIMILHIGVSALRARMRELVGDVRRTAGQARARSMPELVELVEQLGDRAAAFEEREEPASS